MLSETGSGMVVLSISAENLKPAEPTRKNVRGNETESCIYECVCIGAVCVFLCAQAII